MFSAKWRARSSKRAWERKPKKVPFTLYLCDDNTNILVQNSIEYLGKQLENTLAVPNESPATNEIITILHSKIDALEETRDALKAAIAETERQSNVKNHQYEELLAEFTSLNVISLLFNLIPNRLLNKKKEDPRKSEGARSNF